MKKHLSICIASCVMLLAGRGVNAEVSVKIKDISTIDGLKRNQVLGYGLVVGLQGTGDAKSPMTQASLRSILKSFGIEGDDLRSKNAAAVLVTAQLPPFVRIGDRVDVSVSSIGDAKSLEGGILVQSPLRGADNQIYVVAQGPLAVTKPATGRTVRTVASVGDGGIVEREIVPEVITDNSIFIVLKNWDYTVANDIIKAVGEKYPDAKPEMAANGKIRITLGANVPVAQFISDVQNIEITPTLPAIVVIDEKSGTIVTGGQVRVSESLISKEGITVEIANSEKKGSVALLKDASTVKDLVDSLNFIGVTTGDIIAILKGLKDAGALHAELIVK